MKPEKALGTGGASVSGVGVAVAVVDGAVDAAGSDAAGLPNEKPPDGAVNWNAFGGSGAGEGVGAVDLANIGSGGASSAGLLNANGFVGAAAGAGEGVGASDGCAGLKLNGAGAGAAGAGSD